MRLATGSEMQQDYILNRMGEDIVRPRLRLFRDAEEGAVMKVLLTIVAVVLMAPVVFLVGIALGPAFLVLLFIGGIALMTIALGWLIDRAMWHHSHRTRVPSLHR